MPKWRAVRLSIANRSISCPRSKGFGRATAGVNFDLSPAVHQTRKHDTICGMDGTHLRDLVINGLAPTRAWGDAPLLIVKAPDAYADAPTLLATPSSGWRRAGISDTEATRDSLDLVTVGYIAPGASVMPLIKTKRNASAEVVVGRSSLNDVILDDRRVSKTHSWFTPPTPDQAPPLWLIRDGDSTNGTFLNEQRLPSNVSIVLKPSDEIRFGVIDAIFIEASMLEALVDYARETWTRLKII